MKISSIILGALATAAQMTSGSPTISPPFSLKSYSRPTCTAAGINRVNPDINLGNTATEAVDAAFCQLVGYAPNADNTNYFVNTFMANAANRRIDLYNAITPSFSCVEGSCNEKFSNPWNNFESSTSYGPACSKKPGRPDIGAVFMYNHQCNIGHTLNCNNNRVNNHPAGFGGATSPLFGGGKMDLSNAAWWNSEFKDASYAGLQFMLLNAYGFSDTNSVILGYARDAAAASGVKLAMLDDPSEWGTTNYNCAGSTCVSSREMSSVLDFSTPAGITAAADKISAKWWAFFHYATEKDAYNLNNGKIYLLDGKPVIYMYNGFRNLPSSQYAAVTEALKQARNNFKRDFGVFPFIYLDTAFPVNAADGTVVGDARFQWDTFRTTNTAAVNNLYNYNVGGKTYSHAMVRWDSKARDYPYTPFNYRAKDGAILADVLARTATSRTLVLAAWNDLGEGTGINRAYDYYWGGIYRNPFFFMNAIRNAQCN